MDEVARASRVRGLAIALVVVALDQLGKWIAVDVLDLQTVGSIRLLPIFNFTWVQNNGISLNFLAADTHLRRWVLVGFTGAIALTVLIWLWRERNGKDVTALALVLGGAIGNIVDRARLGYVVDFLDLHFGDWHPFLVFNVADTCITVGVLMLVARALFTRRRTTAA